MFKNGFADLAVLFESPIPLLKSVNHHIHVIARKGKTSHANDVIDPNRHGPFALRYDRRESTLRPDGCQLRSQDRLTALNRDTDHTILKILEFRKCTLRNGPTRPIYSR